jgi:selenocysteine lyase/cysteine desulfurase
MTGVRLPNGPPSGLSAALRAKNIFVSIRGDAVRVSPHLYNSQQDILRFVEVLSAHV